MKTMRYILFAAVSVIVAASCTKEQAGDLQQPTGGVDVKAVFEAVPEDDMSKALLQSNGALQWENEDQIGVYQTGKYATNLTRDNSKNIFTSDGTCVFEGEIINYHPKTAGDDKATDNRYTAGYPADRVGYGTATGKANITIPSQQTGLLSDFKKSAVYFGYIRESASTVSYDADNATLTFLKPFNMFCVTPILKFNVPAELKVRKIVVSAKNAEGDVKISGKISDFKPYDGSAIVTTSAKTEIIVENEGSVLTGDVYVALAPDLELDGESHPVFKSSATSLVLNLFLASGASASLTLPLTGEVVAGTIKNLPSLPTSIDWDYPEGPGISVVKINKEKLTINEKSYAARKQILFTPESPESVIKYVSGASLQDVVLANPSEVCGDAGIERQADSTPENYIKLSVSTEEYEDYEAYACTWILNNNYGFGKAISDATWDSQPEHGSTYPIDGTYLYNMSFWYDTLLKASTSNLPQVNSNGFFVRPSSGTSTNWVGTLRIKSPATGKAQMFFDCYAGTDSRTMTMTVNGVNYNLSLAPVGYGVIKSALFDISADDIIELSASKANLRFDSITLLWEPTVTEETTSTESYSAKTSYGN